VQNTFPSWIRGLTIHIVPINGNFTGFQSIIRRPNLPASLSQFSKPNIDIGRGETSVVKYGCSNEKKSFITREKGTRQRAESKSERPGLGSVQGIQLSGLSGRGWQMDKLLYRKKIDGVRQNHPVMAG